MQDRFCLISIILNRNWSRSTKSKLIVEVKDISEEKEQVALIKSVLEAAFSGIYALKAVRDVNGEIIDFVYVFANHLIAQQLQMDSEKMAGQSMLQLIPENRSNGFFELFCTVLRTGNTVRDETHFLTSQINAWFDFIIKPNDQDTLVVTLQDITELKKAMLQLEQQKNLVDNILKNSSNGISVTEMIRDNEGRVIDASTIMANEAAVKFSGPPRDIYMNKTATEIDPGILQSGYGQTCLQTLSTGQPSMFQYYLELTGRWLELTISKMDDDHLIHIFTDITTIKNAEQKMSKYVEDLKQSNASLEQFAYAASHDLKEPIRKIQTFSDRLHVLLMDKLSEKEKFYFNRMSIATERMRTLIDDLLIYSHMSTVSDLQETIDLNSLMESVREDLELEIEEKKAKIEVSPLPAVKGNKRQLQQMLQNLLSNALKYHRPQISPHIEIKSRTITAQDTLLSRIGDECKGAYHLIQMIDNGIGFESTYAEHIFSIFTRLHANAEYLGSGIGLSIVKKVIDNHGGTVWAESSPNKGAVFNILLPVSK